MGDGRAVPVPGSAGAAGSEADALRAGALRVDGLSTESLRTGAPRLHRRAFRTARPGPHVPDREAYRASRGTCFDLLPGRPGDTPGAVSTTEDELLELFRAGEWRSARTTGLRAAFRERFCPYDDGHAAERVVRRLFLGDDDRDSDGYGDAEPDRTATGARPMSPVRERPGPVTPGPSRC
ncbi:CDP-glycerol glycerophosphotransferase family protein [Streptomyces sp. NPDC056004]|uniref:CDP-glycerol glycerophosphotransferase family protein n=1 Tax=Streptomyces sp. NPDC056004 TaxID=3345677 RepID=UPI0035DC8ABE